MSGMTRDEMKAYMETLKAQLTAGEITRAEFNRRRLKVRRAVEQQMFADG